MKLGIYHIYYIAGFFLLLGSVGNFMDLNAKYLLLTTGGKLALFSTGMFNLIFSFIIFYFGYKSKPVKELEIDQEELENELANIVREKKANA